MTLIHELPLTSARRSPNADALSIGDATINYAAFAELIERFAGSLVAGGLAFQDRVAIFSEKSIESVAAMFGAMRAGGVMVPVNPLLKDEQLAYILRDCAVAVLVTTPSRLSGLKDVLTRCPSLRRIVVIGELPGDVTPSPIKCTTFAAACARDAVVPPHRTIDCDLAAIFYTSGSTGGPKGVVLSHRNLVAGAQSVSSYLGNVSTDRILALPPLSFDYGFSQLTTAFLVGACVVLHNYLLASDAIRVLAQEQITGLPAVPPLWLQLVAQPWPADAATSIRYFTNTGGAMPSSTLASLREQMPAARPFLMYGLTEAFRSTYLPPSEIDRRPTSIGKAIPGAQILVLRPDGSHCNPGESGELVHRGSLVSLGYWNDLARTSERFKLLPALTTGTVLPEIAVWSGDIVTSDDEGFLYFVSRHDEMIKCSGYRISPSEVEEAVYKTGLVAECAALGVAHPALGQAVVLVAQPMTDCGPDSSLLITALRDLLPSYMVPAQVDWLTQALIRNPNGKIDRKQLATERVSLFTAQISPPTAKLIS